MRIQRASFHEVVRRARAAGKRVVGGGPFIRYTFEDILPRLAEPRSARATAPRVPARFFTIRRRLDASPRYRASGRG